MAEFLSLTGYQTNYFETTIEIHHYVYFDAILTLHNAYPLVRRCVSKNASC